MFKIATDSSNELDQDRLMSRNAIWQRMKSIIVYQPRTYTCVGNMSQIPKCTHITAEVNSWILCGSSNVTIFMCVSNLQRFPSLVHHANINNHVMNKYEVNINSLTLCVLRKSSPIFKLSLLCLHYEWFIYNFHHTLQHEVQDGHYITTHWNIFPLCKHIYRHKH